MNVGLEELQLQVPAHRPRNIYTLNQAGALPSPYSVTFNVLPRLRSWVVLPT